MTQTEPGDSDSESDRRLVGLGLPRPQSRGGAALTMEDRGRVMPQLARSRPFGPHVNGTASPRPLTWSRSAAASYGAASESD